MGWLAMFRKRASEEDEREKEKAFEARVRELI